MHSAQSLPAKYFLQLGNVAFPLGKTSSTPLVSILKFLVFAPYVNY